MVKIIERKFEVGVGEIYRTELCNIDFEPDIDDMAEIIGLRDIEPDEWLRAPYDDTDYEYQICADNGEIISHFWESEIYLKYAKERRCKSLNAILNEIASALEQAYSACNNQSWFNNTGYEAYEYDLRMHLRNELAWQGYDSKFYRPAWKLADRRMFQRFT